MAGMANDDLEKYAKALDRWVHNVPCFNVNLIFNSAIMKYHSLKMEEVNDTMRHLWNKTYQGTGVYYWTVAGLWAYYELQTPRASRSVLTGKGVATGALIRIGGG